MVLFSELKSGFLFSIRAFCKYGSNYTKFELLTHKNWLTGMIERVIDTSCHLLKVVMF